MQQVVNSANLKSASSSPIRATLVLARLPHNIMPIKLLLGDKELAVKTLICAGEKTFNGSDIELLNSTVFDKHDKKALEVIELKNFSPFKSLSNFFGLINPGILYFARKSDCMVVYGHGYATLLLALISGKLFRKSLLVSTDATSFGDSLQFKTVLKRSILSFIYKRIADGVLVPSTRAKNLLLELGVKKDHIFLTPYSVDPANFVESIWQNSRKEIRESLGAKEGQRIILGCGKFIARKGYEDLVRAFALQSDSTAMLVLIGDGPEKQKLKNLAVQLGVIERLRLPGFVQYRDLSKWYASCDLIVHPAHHEPFGLVVNEALLMKKPLIVSDAVGASEDLVRHEKTGFVYKARNIQALATLLNCFSSDPLRFARCAEQGRTVLEESWTPTVNAHATAEAIKTVSKKRKKILLLNFEHGRLGDCWMRLLSLYSIVRLNPSLKVKVKVPQDLLLLAQETFGNELDITDSCSENAWDFQNSGLSKALCSAVKGTRVAMPYGRIGRSIRKNNSLKTKVQEGLSTLFDKLNLICVPPHNVLGGYQGFVELMSIPQLRKVSYQDWQEQSILDLVALRAKFSRKQEIEPKLVVFPSGTDHQFMPNEWLQKWLPKAILALHTRDPRLSYYKGTSNKIEMFNDSQELLDLALSSSWCVTTDSFPSHLLQTFSKRVTICLSQQSSKAVVHPGFQGVVVDCAMPCSPCAGPNIPPELCYMGHRVCGTWDQPHFTSKILSSIGVEAASHV